MAEHQFTYEGKTLEDVLSQVNRDHNEYKVVSQKNKREFPNIFKKRVELVIDVPRKAKELIEKKPVIKQETKERVTNNKQIITDVLESKRETKGKRTKDYYEEQKKELEHIKKEAGKELVAKQQAEEKKEKEEEYASFEQEQVRSALKKSLIEVELSEPVIERLISGINMRESKEEIQANLIKHVEDMLHVTGKEAFEAEGVYSLIGPTGVGKTTTIAKLAGILVGEGKKVALITTDVYRIGAVDQLKIYAKILSSPLTAVSTPQELKKEVKAYKEKGYQYILLDTVGRNPMEPDSITGIQDYLTCVTIEHTALVLSATKKQRDVKKIVDNYKQAAIQSVLFTKLDETSSYGSLLNVCVENEMPISYVTYGQEVPIDLAIAEKELLAQKIIGEVFSDGSSENA